MTRVTLKSLSLAAAVALAAPAAHAATATGSLLVSATVLDTCLVVATPLAFGSLDGGAATPDLAPATVTVTCTASKAGITVSLGAGDNVSGGQRHMISADDDEVPYSVFTDAGRSASVAVDGDIFDGPVTAAIPTAFSLYGLIPAGSYSTGIYSDTVTITVDY